MVKEVMQQLNILMVASEQQKLSFEEICPRWSKVIHRTTEKTDKYRYKQDHKILDMKDCRKCLVGEAYGFKGNYWDDCARCHNYSSRFSNILWKCPSERQASIDRFVEHFNNVHL